LLVLQLLATAIVSGNELTLTLAQPLHFFGGFTQLIRRALAGSANLLLLPDRFFIFLRTMGCHHQQLHRAFHIDAVRFLTRNFRLR
jgi:hypothetical protein